MESDKKYITNFINCNNLTIDCMNMTAETGIMNGEAVALAANELTITNST
jgi:hypothetical protein